MFLSEDTCSVFGYVIHELEAMIQEQVHRQLECGRLLIIIQY